MTDPDDIILTRLKKPIEELVTNYFPDCNPYQRFRLRQLAWQAVDLLAKNGDIANLRTHKDILRLINDARLLGASDRFVEDSLGLAVQIYQRLEIDHPDVLSRYHP